ncbi:hypothetical protein T440DRAFT_527290 [Plenodomus tracheiphilus IPT5]|uniref:Aminoglycoside phosphotransferase domain-containing protein n=1 Tax=Plenodomus tracheiphilus IPT5 TaxID=1408161 RepID=A0A6A7B916_9PLEO|nr:hypothetical protein T440DRAFT_527290 [Plenodomus tracheiphilus IPT5]
MNTKAEISQKHYNVQTWSEAIQARFELRRAAPQPPLSAFTKLTIPYEAPGIPDITLPSFEEIRQAIASKTDRLDLPGAFRAVCKVRNMIVKLGYHETLVQEAEDLLWLQKNTTVRAPKLYWLFSALNCGREAYFLVMERLPGITLDWTMWGSLSGAQHEKIHLSIAQQLQLLRSVSSNYYGRVDNQGFHPHDCYVATDQKAPCGPYKTYNELIAATYEAAELKGARKSQRFDASRGEHNNQDNFRPDQVACLTKFQDFYAQARGHEPKLTHTDLWMSNWIIRPLDGKGEPLTGESALQDATDYDVTFIDWCGMGWYPAWMQRVTLRRIGGPSKEDRKRFQERVMRYFDEDYEDVLKMQEESSRLLAYDVVDG